MPRPHGLRLTRYSRPRSASWPSATFFVRRSASRRTMNASSARSSAGTTIIGLLVIEDVDLVRIDELGELERLLALQLDRLELLVVEQDVAALLILIALDDLVGIDRADAGHDLLIFDPLAGRLVDLVEGDGRAALGGGEDLDRDRDQGEPDLSLPIGACGHDCVLPDSIRCRFNPREGEGFRPGDRDPPEAPAFDRHPPDDSPPIDRVLRRFAVDTERGLEPARLFSNRAGLAVERRHAAGRHDRAVRHPAIFRDQQGETRPCRSALS